MPPAARAGGQCIHSWLCSGLCRTGTLHHLERKGQAGQIQELRRVSLHIGKSYTSHTWDLLSWAAQHYKRPFSLYAAVRACYDDTLYRWLVSGTLEELL